MEEVTYTLMCNGVQYGTITRTQVHQGKAWDATVPAMYTALLEAHKYAAELMYDNQCKDWFGEHERDQCFINLINSLNTAIQAMKD